MFNLGWQFFIQFFWRPNCIEEECTTFFNIAKDIICSRG